VLRICIFQIFTEAGICFGRRLMFYLFSVIRKTFENAGLHHSELNSRGLVSVIRRFQLEHVISVGR